MPIKILLKDESETQRLGALFSNIIQIGDVIALNGVVGAGKTHFVRSTIQAALITAGHSEDIPSPSFSLVQIYETQKFEIWHSDLYRLSSEDEAYELGLIEAFDHSVVFIEWPEKLRSILPKRHLNLLFETQDNENERVLNILDPSEHWSQRLLPILETFPNAI